MAVSPEAVLAALASLVGELKALLARVCAERGVETVQK